MAGAGYDVSSSNAHSAADAANQYAGTVFNFSSPGATIDQGASQTATPTSTATAATKSPGVSGGSPAPNRWFGGPAPNQFFTPQAAIQVPQAKSNTLLIAFAAVGALLSLLLFLRR